MSNQTRDGRGVTKARSIPDVSAGGRYAVLALRLVLGWVFFYSGVDKLLDPGWTAAGYLTHAVPAGNPVPGLWETMAGLPLVDVLVQWGMLLIGVCLLLGALVRWSALWGAVMMLLFWASSLPLEHGLLVDQHVVYVVALFGLAALGAGRIAGLDGRLEASQLLDRYPRLRYVLG